MTIYLLSFLFGVINVIGYFLCLSWASCNLTPLTCEIKL